MLFFFFFFSDVVICSLVYSEPSLCLALDFAPSLSRTALGRACEEGLRPAQVIIAELEGAGHVKQNPSKINVLTHTHFSLTLRACA